MALQSRATVKTDSNGSRIIADNIDIEKFADLIRAESVRETSAEYRIGWNDGQLNEREAIAKYIKPTEEHRRDASWGYMGGEEGLAMLDGIAASILSGAHHEH